MNIIRSSMAVASFPLKPQKGPWCHFCSHLHFVDRVLDAACVLDRFHQDGFASSLIARAGGLEYRLTPCDLKKSRRRGEEKTEEENEARERKRSTEALRMNILD